MPFHTVSGDTATKSVCGVPAGPRVRRPIRQTGPCSVPDRLCPAALVRTRLTLWLPYGMTDEPELPPHASSHLLSASANRLNRLRAAVLGSNDGLISIAGLVVGVAATTSATTTLAFAGLSGLVAGSLSMGGGEYTSVRAQRDSQDALLRAQEAELEAIPDEELDELTLLYVWRGLSVKLARQVAKELTDRDALAAHAEAELGIQLDDLVSPWQASIASALSFLAGGLLSLLAILLPPPKYRILVCVLAVIMGLALTGYVSAVLGQAPARRATVRNIMIGGATMAVTYGLGTIGHALS